MESYNCFRADKKLSEAQALLKRRRFSDAKDSLDAVLKEFIFFDEKNLRKTFVVVNQYEKYIELIKKYERGLK